MAGGSLRRAHAGAARTPWCVVRPVLGAGRCGRSAASGRRRKGRPPAAADERPPHAGVEHRGAAQPRGGARRLRPGGLQRRRRDARRRGARQADRVLLRKIGRDAVAAVGRAVRTPAAAEPRRCRRQRRSGARGVGRARTQRLPPRRHRGDPARYAPSGFRATQRSCVPRKKPAASCSTTRNRANSASRTNPGG